MKKSNIILAAVCAAGFSYAGMAEANSDWYRHAAISPDGKTVLFSHKGDIYKVSAKGGDAVPLTLHGAWEGHPVWSRDGRQIAFASDRNGNLDVYVMPAQGGKATRLTHHSSNDVPTDFSPDGSAVLFSANRTDSATSLNYPTRALNELYAVSVTGGTPRMLDTNAATEARYSKDGKRIAYRKEKALESDLRKHDTSAFARDIWIKDLSSGDHTQVTDFAGGDHTPVWDGNDTLYYLSEQANNVFNVHKMKLGGSAEQITSFDTHPVRSLSVSKSGTLAYTWHGSLYTQKGSKPKKLDIAINVDSAANAYKTLPMNGNITEFAVSPNGKEVAFIARGEVFVTSTDFATTKRITNTPEQERSLSFHKDGRTLLYTSSRGDSWKLYEANIADEDEKYFFASTTIEEKLLHGADTESFQPLYSPDGEKVAFLSQRDEIQVVDRETGTVTVALDKKHNASYADGDITFGWSPDSKWLTADFAPRGRMIMTNIGVFPADGSAEPVDISKSGYMNTSPAFSEEAGAVIWASSRFGMRAHSSWGRQFDVMATFLNQDAYDKFSLSKEEYQLKKELDKDKEKKAKEEADKKAKEEADKEDEADSKEDADSKEADAEKDAKEEELLDIDWDNLDERTVRLTQHSSNLGSYVLTKDMSKMYYTARFEGGFDLWEQDFREGKVKLAAKLGARNVGLALSSDGKTLFMLADGTIRKSAVGKIQPKPVAAQAVMELKPAQERAHMFEHAWRKIKDKFYNPNFHGIDWDLMKADYAAKLPSISNNRDLARMMEEMMGELNASHTGTYYRHQQAGADATASLGLIYDLSDTSSALTIDEVIARGPVDKAASKITAGMKLSAVDGVTLDGSRNLAALLNNKAGKRVRITITDADGNSFDEVIKPITQGAEVNLMYDRWVKLRTALVEERSGGRLGYVHIRSMNDASFRRIYNKVLGEYFDREAIIIDTRWNNGGWLHQDLTKLFAGKNYLNFRVRGREYTGEPTDQWFKPSMIVINEGNYSDAHTFPYAYKRLGLGDAVGMPVPGTSTSVWWEGLMSGDMVFGVPQLGNITPEGDYLENVQVEPDVMVDNDPRAVTEGDDKQLKKAVDVMLQKLDSQN